MRNAKLVESAEEETLPRLPERRLLAAVLEKAFLDLDPLRTVSRGLRETAVSWFRGDAHIIPYCEVADYLGLSPSRRARIEERVAYMERMLGHAKKEA
jgi:hypothetical protein